MKNLFYKHARIAIVAFFLCATSAFAQKPLTYSKVIAFEGQSATELYQKAKLWVASSFQNASKVIQVDDPSQNMISLKTDMEYVKSGLTYLAYEGWLHFNVMIQCKDGRARMQIMNITHENKPRNASSCSLGLILDTDEQFTKGAEKSFHNKVCKDIKEKMQIESEALFVSFSNFNGQNTEEEW